MCRTDNLVCAHTDRQDCLSSPSQRVGEIERRLVGERIALAGHRQLLLHLFLRDVGRRLNPLQLEAEFVGVRGPAQRFVERDQSVLVEHVERLIERLHAVLRRDRKSTRLNSSHSQISYAVFCLKKKKKKTNEKYYTRQTQNRRTTVMS